MAKKQKYQFKVLLFDFSKSTKEEYDVIPYFESQWKNKRNFFNKRDVKNFEDFKEWIKRASSYMYWARCQYEFLMAPWPFGSKKLNEEITNFFKGDVNLFNTDDNIKFTNIILNDMYKIDIHEQLMMNIDVFAEILMKHLGVNFENVKKKK